MERNAWYARLRFFQAAVVCLLLIALSANLQSAPAASTAAPMPLLKAGHPVDWWFVFKFNSNPQVLPGCSKGASPTCLFGGTVQDYAKNGPFGQQFAFSSSEHGVLQLGSNCVGDTTSDPLGATFDQIYNGTFHYVIWNDQFKDDPNIPGDAPWGHSKGLLAWNDDGTGLVLQVSTPSWPAAGSKKTPRQSDGNTLGCVKDNDVEVSQHFFSLKLTKADVVTVLKAMQNASVATKPTLPQIVNNGGPADIQALVSGLGVKSKSTTFSNDRLSSGVHLISKPSSLHAPPWQMVSAVMGGVDLRVATWVEGSGAIPSTTASTKLACWSSLSKLKAGAVEIATSGHWEGKEFGLIGGIAPDHNHAKIGVTTSGQQFAIFGDMNQDGDALVEDPKQCASSQNGRGGMFFVVDNADLFKSVTGLISGKSAPTTAPAKPPTKGSN